MREIVREHWDETNHLLYQRVYRIFNDTMMVRLFSTCAFQENIEVARGGLFEVIQSPLWFSREFVVELAEVFEEQIV